ncbi:response regulator transcription factor [Sphingomonas naphthae]|uniref:Response regulator transcription factor n=1 Tax=Sphingomonas naphthae TaxID=1813468 RepID=A0ABY7THQ7_9SPHN|nr:response regulator transcription factor [Sphingomonas naphthae]WCT72738.1 response regulator transcription factor [Sphingomonas naphthae]
MRLLLVEDDADTAGLLAAELAKGDHHIAIARDGREALDQATSGRFDAIVLDRMLPRIDGLTVLKLLRDEGVATPVIVVSALGELMDRVEGLDAGADDYLVKPVAPIELSARLAALQRRPATGQTAVTLKAGSIEIDTVGHVALRRGRTLDLRPTEFTILTELVRNAGRVVTRRMLADAIWGSDFEPATNIIESHVRGLRAELNLGEVYDAIRTIRRVGYVLRASA